MTNEAEVIELYGYNGDGCPVQVTVASNAAIAKGAVLRLTSPNTGSLASGVAQPCAGIAAEGKVNNDYAVKMTAWTDGLFNIVASQAIPVGAWVQTSTTGSLNYVEVATGVNISGAYSLTSTSGAAILGYAKSAGVNNTRTAIRIRL